LALETGFFILSAFDINMKIQGTVSWGIIGCGDVCEVKSGPAFNKVENSKLVAVMRRDASKAKDYARRHGVPRVYDDATALINDPEVNAIYIATPPSTHELYLEQALKAGKPVYVEKPVTVNLASCQRMVKSAQELNGLVSVAHYRRGLTLFNIVKALVQEGHIGDIRLVQLRTLQASSGKHNHKSENNWRIDPAVSGGGIFHDLSPHQLDIMYWIFGKPKTIHGFSVNQSKSYDAPDVTMLQATFENDVCLSGIWSFNVAAEAAEEKCEIIGDQGKLVFSFFKLGALEVITSSGKEILPMDYPDHVQQPLIDSVVKYFRGEGPNPCSLEEALEVMEMMEAVAGIKN
jgi:1,5-anhydro-D-fructose reductase (1,5-anhydro-D-mannitol-forming)